MNQLRKLRKMKGLSQQKLSKLSGVDRSLISNMERGAAKNVTMRTLERLSVALDCEPKDLL